MDALNTNSKKHVLMAPIPFGCGPLKLLIVRNNKGLNKLHPYFTLFIERPYGVKIALLYAQKRKFKKDPNYLISMDKTFKDRNDEQVLGKLRAIGANVKFILYDNGENY